jgi:two-component system, chemotaxis family, sensor kinase CheA
MLDQFKATFKEESFELLSTLEDTFLELESQPLNGELINAAFRAIHTIKGSAAMFGFDSVSRFAHEFETALDLCRNGTLSVTKDFIGLALKGRDYIKRLLDFEEPVPAEVLGESSSLLERLREFSKKVAPKAGEASTGPAAAPEPEKAGKGTYRIEFRPSIDIFKNGTRVLSLVEELARLGQADVFPRTEGIPLLAELDPEACYCWWDVLLTGEVDENAIRDVFIFVAEQSVLKIEKVDSDEGAPGSPGKRLGDILIERGEASADSIREALASKRRLGEVLVERKVVSRQQVESALVEQEHLKKVQEKTEATVGSIRVASDKLDALVDLVGELVTLQARLSRTSIDLMDGQLSSISEQFERLIAQLRDNTMSIRMLPIGSTFNKFRRVVRDLSLELGKECELLTEGAETELDKTVIEKLGDPLVHIIRNSIDHGVERPEGRQAAGKPRTGTIKLSALHSGAYVLIRISDDGKGLDRDAIREKAIQRGLVSPSQEMSDQETIQLIFEPGFSTAKVVTTVSGRGVGMDVVKREIDSLGGSVQVESEPGRGMTVTLKIPLTLAIIEGLLVRIGPEYYVVPLSSVDGCIEIPRSELAAMGERRIISYRNEFVPFVVLRDFFDDDGAAGGAEAEEPEIEQIVIASAQDTRVGFVVDQVIGDNQTVIKPLGRLYRDVEGISGATILGDGTVALILDINRLSLVVQREGAGRASGAA